MTFEPLAITQDVRLTLTCKAGALLDVPLSMAAIVGEVNNGELFSFVYDRNVPSDDPNEEYTPRTS